MYDKRHPNGTQKTYKQHTKGTQKALYKTKEKEQLQKLLFSLFFRPDIQIFPLKCSIIWFNTSEKAKPFDSLCCLMNSMLDADK